MKMEANIKEALMGVMNSSREIIKNEQKHLYPNVSRIISFYVRKILIVKTVDFRRQLIYNSFYLDIGLGLSENQRCLPYL